MGSREELASLLDDLGRSMGIAGLKLGPDGLAALAFEGGPVLHFGHEVPSGLAVLYAELPPPAGERPAVLQRLLEANLTAAETGGGSFALGAQGQVFLLRRFAPRGLGYPEFEAAVRAFVDAAEVWQTRLTAPDVAADTAPRADAAMHLRA